MVKSIFKIDFFLIKYYTLLSGDDMEKLLLIKYGELSTKKDNINFFIKTLKDNIEVSLKNIDANITYDKGRMFIRTSEDNFDNVIDKLKHVFGIHEIVVAYELDNTELDNIKNALIEIIKDENEDITNVLQTKDNLTLVNEYMKNLSKREKEILSKRYGLMNRKEMTQKEIAKEMKISRSYVSRIEKRALTKILREFIKNNKAN